MEIGRPVTEVHIPLSQEKSGRLFVYTAPPGAEVFIDSEYYGTARPFVAVDDLAYGQHLLWVRLEGYASERELITVEEETDRGYRVHLEKEM